MKDSLLNRLDETTLRTLVERAGARDTALITVGETLHIEDRNEVAAQLTKLRPLERVDQVLSEVAVTALRTCIREGEPCTVYEELDDVLYRLELIPREGGALLAFLRDDRADYDGSLRALHVKTIDHLGKLLADAEQIEDAALAAKTKRHCLRLDRMLIHSDLLHDPPMLEHLRLEWDDLSEQCREAAEQVAAHSEIGRARTIDVQVPEECIALTEPRLIRTALYNLLTNALRVTPPTGDIAITLHDDGKFFTITVADRGRGMDAELFHTLLTGWHRSMPFEDYISITRKGASPGLGLPLTQRIAQVHGGNLLLSPREGGGSQLHLSIAHLPEALAENSAHAPMLADTGYTLEELEFSVLD